MFQKTIESITGKVKKRFKYYAHTKRKLRRKPEGQFAEVNFGAFLLNRDMGRYSFILCQMLKFSGFKVVVKLDPRFFLNEVPYKQMLLAQDFTKVRGSNAPNRAVLLHGPGEKRKQLNFICSYKLIDEQIDAYYLPYTLHPRFYRTFSDNTNFDACRKASRATRIIFSGNFERSLYNNKVLKDNFGWTISRVDILDHVKSAYKDDPRILYAPTQKHFYDLLRQAESRSKFIIAEVKTDPEDWLKILSSGDFYLCLPGMGMPWSHNAFEAMAVGTIPIIQYNHLFNPLLVHQENCLAYHDFDSFNTALELALNMKPEEVECMKANVIAYYDAYISTKQIIKRIQSFYASDEETLTIALPYLNEEI
jgi:hypothetical protein